MKIFKEDVDFSSENVMSAVAITDIVNTIINKIYETIGDLNSLRLALQDVDYDDLMGVVSNVIAEENTNIGKLQQISQLLLPESSGIEIGKQEAVAIIDDSNEDIYNKTTGVPIQPTTIIIGEGIKNSNNLARQKRALREEDTVNQCYLSYYKERPEREADGTTYAKAELIDYEDFFSESDARKALEEKSSELKEQGFVKHSPILYIKPSRLVGADEYYIIENELGSEEHEPSNL